MATRRFTGQARRIANEIRKAEHQYGTEIRKALLEIWNDSYNRLTPEFIEEFLRTGILPLNDASYREFSHSTLFDVWENTLNRGIRIEDPEGVNLPADLMIARRDAYNVWMHRESSKFITNMATQERDATRSMLEYFARTESMTVNEMSDAMRGISGMTRPQVAALQKRRQELIAAGVDNKTLLRETNRYKRKLQQFRAKRIVQTEIQAGMNAAIIETGKARADREGKIVRKKIVAYPDCCDFCQEIELAQPVDGIAVDASFDEVGVFAGNPPFHPFCRCVVLMLYFDRLY